ncbi:MAG: hypothetical protein ABIR23_09180 [Novosphingobium sp.]
MNTLKKHRLMLAIMLALTVQLALFTLSMDTGTFSVFCTGGTNKIANLYQFLHIGYLILFVVGISGLFKKSLGLAYLFAVALTIPALVFQPPLVSEGRLTCDAP